MTRTLNVVRMQLINRQTYVWMPLIILGGSFALSLLVFALIPTDAPKFSGAAQAPLWYLLAIGVQALVMTFPFSQAMSVTRREFLFGALLTAALAAALLAVIFVLGGLVEQATEGWWMNGYYFYQPWTWQEGPLVAGFFFAVMAWLLFIVGFWAATVYKRFGGTVLTIVLVGLGLVFVGLLWLVGRLDAWVEVGNWIASAGTLGITISSLVVAAVLAAVAYLTIRRAVP